MKQALSHPAAVGTLGGRGRGPRFHWNHFTMRAIGLLGSIAAAPLGYPPFAGMDMIPGHLT
jgi:hypothetical protein